MTTPNPRDEAILPCPFCDALSSQSLSLSEARAENDRKDLEIERLKGLIAGIRECPQEPRIVEAVVILQKARSAYIAAIQNSTVDGETEAERRASHGEARDYAAEVMVGELGALTFEHVDALVSDSRPEDTAEHFIQAAVDSAPEPLRRLGEWLTHVLDDDDWKTADRMLTGAVVALARAQSALENGPAGLADAHTNPPLSDLSSLRRAEVAVRPLEWEQHNCGSDEYLTTAQAGPFDERYEIESTYASMKSSFQVRRSRDIQPFAWRDAIEAAKSAAQSDYETRIRSALVSGSREDGDG